MSEIFEPSGVRCRHCGSYSHTREQSLYCMEKDFVEMCAKYKQLEHRLFNEQEHYAVLKDNYDEVFNFIAHKYNTTPEQEFESFIEYVRNQGEELV